MGTHPIFESDFDCLTEKKKNKKKMDDLGFINFDEFPDDFGTISEILNESVAESGESSSDDGFSGSVTSATPNNSPPQSSTTQSSVGSPSLDDLLSTDPYTSGFVDEILVDIKQQQMSPNRS